MPTLHLPKGNVAMTESLSFNPMHHYDVFGAHGYDRDLYGLVGLGRQRALEQVLPHLHDGMSVLDVACGTGTWLASLTAHASLECTGLDISSSMLQLAARKVTLKPICADARAVAEHVPAESIDIASTHFVFGFVEPRPIIQAVARALRPGGLYSVVSSTLGSFRKLQQLSEPFLSHQDLLDGTHAPTSLDELCRWLAVDGFTVVTTSVVDKDFAISTPEELFDLGLGVGWFAQYATVFEQVSQKPDILASLLPIHDHFEAFAVLARKRGSR